VPVDKIFRKTKARRLHGRFLVLSAFAFGRFFLCHFAALSHWSSFRYFFCGLSLFCHKIFPLVNFSREINFNAKNSKGFLFLLTMIIS